MQDVREWPHNNLQFDEFILTFFLDTKELFIIPGKSPIT